MGAARLNTRKVLDPDGATMDRARKFLFGMKLLRALRHLAGQSREGRGNCVQDTRQKKNRKTKFQLFSLIKYYILTEMQQAEQ
jgi:hypothetical protein